MEDSLFEMTRFDPGGQEDKQEDIILDNINNKLKEKRKLQTPTDADNEAVTEPVKKKRKKSKKKKNNVGDNIEGFTILGDPTDQKVKKVNRVLPLWLAQPNILSVDLLSDKLAVGDMPGLDKVLVDKLMKEKVTHFFPVQRQVIPHLLEFSPRYRPSDLCVSAPTGSGKTLAFVLPIVQSLLGRLVPRVRAITVLPTQNLATQVYKVFNHFCEGSGLRVKLLTGGENMAEEGDLVRKGVAGMVHQLYDILVVTPGRLIHTIRDTPGLDLSHLRYLVIDEADRMMDNMTGDWLTILETSVYSRGRTRPGLLTAAAASQHHIPLQKLLFSATLSQDPEQLEQLNLFEPKLYRCLVPVAALGEAVSMTSLPVTLTQLFTISKQGDKPALVHQVIKEKSLTKVLVFTHSNETVHRLALVLEKLGHKVGELSSAVKGRKKVLSKLQRGVIDIVVCSDVMARGIDVEGLDGVVSYDVPAYSKAYIHRVGRTARAGKEGTAISLCEEKQVKNFIKMLKDGGIEGVEELKISEEKLESWRDEYVQCLDSVKNQLQEEKDGKQESKEKKGEKKKNS